MQTKGGFPRFRHAADQALIAEFGNQIDEKTHCRIIALDRHLEAHPIIGVTEIVPTYCTLCLHYDSSRTTAQAIIGELRGRLSHGARTAGAQRVWTVPALYGPPAGCDLDEVASLHDMCADDVIALHMQAHYHVAMIGFMPGYAYLGGLPERLHTSRRRKPRLAIPPGSIAIGGMQTSISSVEAPSGWQLLGRTPLRLFDPQRTPAVLMQPGDEVRFRRVDASEAAELDRISKDGGSVATCMPCP